jgi:citrate lyase subunit beta/citryl-CoA lyase
LLSFSTASLEATTILTQGGQQGRELGFDGKTLIHPGQIEGANAAFAPDSDEVQHARDIIDAWDAARAEGKGLVVLNGSLIENLHVEEAQRTLALTEASPP